MRGAALKPVSPPTMLQLLGSHDLGLTASGGSRHVRICFEAVLGRSWAATAFGTTVVGLLRSFVGVESLVSWRSLLGFRLRVGLWTAGAICWSLVVVHSVASLG